MPWVGHGEKRGEASAEEWSPLVCLVASSNVLDETASCPNTMPGIVETLASSSSSS